MSEIVEIVRLAHGGDGVTADGVFVPYTIPGDVVRIDGGSSPRLEEVVEAGPWRTEPKCRHFGHCGGCSLQHVTRDAYLAWKRDLIDSALTKRGLKNAPIENVRTVEPGTRRRAVINARSMADGVVLGFHEARSDELVDILECPVLVPRLADALPKIRSKLGNLMHCGEAAVLHLTQTSAGLDVSLNWKRVSGPDTHFALAEFAQELNLARLSWNGEPVAVARAPYLRIGRHTVFLPVEPFLQPTSEGEAILQSLVREGVQGAGHVADLFAGCGTFALGLSQTRSITAVEGNMAMAAALNDAAAEKGSKIVAERRDLYRRPLLASELATFDAVILDPPRQGAKAQAEQLAKSDVARIVYASCNPSSFARDARILSDGGYKLRRLVPVDQFLWSAHVELVAFLERNVNH